MTDYLVGFAQNVSCHQVNMAINMNTDGSLLI